MKRKLSIILCMALICFAFAGCSSNMPKEEPPVDAGSATGTVKTGLAIISSIDKSTSATATAEGLAQADSSVVAVLVDKDGKIVNCVIDGVQTKANFTQTGMISTDLTTLYQSKNELGKAYGMGEASSIGKEWNEQAAYLADYVTGKTLTEVKGIKLTETGAPADSELAASVTYKIGSTLEAIEKAVSNAQDLGAKSGDKLGLGTSTNIEKSVNATAEAEGFVQAYSTYTATTFASDGTITSCVIDGSQCNVNFNTSGEITSDLAAPQKTKNELGADYGMKKASSIGKEWNEEAAAYATYATGKTAKDLNGIALTEKGAPDVAELTSSVTISVGVFNDVITKSYDTAK